MTNDRFLAELEEHLAENRRLVSQSFLPHSLQGPASYLGFHTFRTLFFLSLTLTICLFLFAYTPLIQISRQLFFYP
jgi:hypothetical protein